MDLMILYCTYILVQYVPAEIIAESGDSRGYVHYCME